MRGVNSVHNARIPNFPSCPCLCVDMRFICPLLNHKFRGLTRELLVGTDLGQRVKKVKPSRYRPGELPRGFQEVKVPGFHDSGTGWW